MGRSAASMLHVDLDAFYASVEQLEDPSLRGRPVVVGGLGPRGVVSAASYEARAFGVRSAMPTAHARRACPQGVFLAPRFDLYARRSREVMAILRSVTPLVEQLSVDEAFLDVAGARRSHGSGAEIASMLRRRIRAETGLVASVGVATTKFLAKLASDLAKPDGLLVVEPGGELDLLHPLPVDRLWGVGPATLARLERLAVRTVGDLAALPVEVLVSAVGAVHGRHLHALAHNRDDRPVVERRVQKSLGAEETFDADVTERAALDRELVRLADRLARRLRAAGIEARTLALKVRFADFATITRSRTLQAPTASASVLLGAGRELLSVVDLRGGVRLLGLSASLLAPPAPTQGVLELGDRGDGTPRADRRAALERAADAVRSRFGDRAVLPARLVERAPQQELRR